MAGERIDYIIAIAEEKNVTKAAERLYVSQPALTQYIRRLEKEYGITLFDRSKTPLELTETGRFFLQEKLRIEAEEQQMRRKLELMASGRISVSIGCGPARSVGWIPPVLQDFTVSHPEADITLLNSGEGGFPDLLLRKKLDLAIGAFDTDHPKILCRQLGVETLRLWIPLEYGIIPDDFDIGSSLEQPYRLNPQDLDGLPFIIPAEDQGSYSSFRLLIDSYHIKPGREISPSQATPIRALTRAGLGCSFAVARNVRELQDDDGSWWGCYAMLPGLPGTRFSSVAYRRDHPRAELLEELAQLVIRHFGKMQAEGRSFP